MVQRSKMAVKKLDHETLAQQLVTPRRQLSEADEMSRSTSVVSQDAEQPASHNTSAPTDTVAPSTAPVVGPAPTPAVDVTTATTTTTATATTAADAVATVSAGAGPDSNPKPGMGGQLHRDESNLSSR